MTGNFPRETWEFVYGILVRGIGYGAHHGERNSIFVTDLRYRGTLHLHTTHTRQALSQVAYTLTAGEEFIAARNHSRHYNGNSLFEEGALELGYVVGQIELT